jgi:hypothetical protein
MLLKKLIFLVKYGILKKQLYVGFWRYLGGRDMKKVFKTFLQAASICAVVVMLTMGINFALGVNVRISYYMVMLTGFILLSLIWSVGTYLLKLKMLGVPVKKNVRSKKVVSPVPQINYDNIRRRKVS